jgi:PST family polysaccharide transporter
MHGRGIDALVFQTLGQEIACLVLLPLLCNWRPKSFSLRRDAAELASFGGNLSVFRVVQNLASTMDHVSLGLFTTPAVVGLYNRAQTLLSTPRRQLVLPISQVIPTLLSRIQNDEQAFAEASTNLLKATAYVWFAFLALVIAAPSAVLVVVLGEQWDGAALIIQLLAVGEMTRVPLQMINMAETQLGHTASLRNFGLVSAPLTALALLAGSWIGGIQHGALCMAVAYAILLAALLILRTLQIRGKTPFTPLLLWRAHRKPLALCGVLILAFYAGSIAGDGFSPFAELAIVGSFGCAAIGLLLVLIRPAREELRHIISDIRGASPVKRKVAG